MIGYQCVRAPFWQWTILSKMAQCFNNPPPTYERSLPLPSRAPWGPFWILLFSPLLNPFALSWHPFICIAWCLVLPLCLVPLRMLYLVCGSLSSLLSHQPWMLLLFPSWLHVWKAGSPLTPGLVLVPRFQDSICLLLSPSVLDDSGRQTGQFGKMNTSALSSSLVLIPGFSSPSSNFPRDVLRISEISELSSFDFTVDEALVTQPELGDPVLQGEIYRDYLLSSLLPPFS